MIPPGIHRPVPAAGSGFPPSYAGPDPGLPAFVPPIRRAHWRLARQTAALPRVVVKAKRRSRGALRAALPGTAFHATAPHLAVSAQPTHQEAPGVPGWMRWRFPLRLVQRSGKCSPTSPPRGAMCQSLRPAAQVFPSGPPQSSPPWRAPVGLHPEDLQFVQLL